MWLVVAICAVSSLLVLAVVLYGAGRWAPRAAVLGDYNLLGPALLPLVQAPPISSLSSTWLADPSTLIAAKCPSCSPPTQIQP